MKVAVQRPVGDAVGPATTSVVAIASSRKTRQRIARALAAQELRTSVEVEDSAGVAHLKVDASTILVFACDIDESREVTRLRRLRREAPKPAVVVISPPTTGTGVRRALDAGADALVFEPELELTLAATVRAVASGQSVVPRKLRASVERPNLSHREGQVLTLVRKGLTNAEIAERLYLAESTIKSHLSSIFTKFGVRSRMEAAAVSLDLEQTLEAISKVSAGDVPGRAAG
jgi:DNA-binding NarL/FixJ family response regulator